MRSNNWITVNRTRYSRSAGDEVRREMHRYKRGSARNGQGGRAGKVKNRRQAIAIGLSKARKKRRSDILRSGGSLHPHDAKSRIKVYMDV